jgi:hypothetical protein
MRAKTYRRALLARILLALAFTLALMCAAATAAYALTDESADEGQPTPPAVTEPEPEPAPVADPVELTTDGQMTLVDDIGGDEATDKQFLTIITKGGNYFYLVIDRAGDTENVHFLNLVDESDLLALIEDGTGTAAATTPEPVEPTPTEPEPVSEPEPEAEPGTGLSAILGITLLLALAGGGALFYVKVLKPKRAGKAAAVPSDTGGFGFEDDELDELPEGDIDIMEPDGQAEPYSYEDYEEREDGR